MKDLRCLVRWHKYVKHHAPDTNGWYLECSRCGEMKDAALYGGPHTLFGP